MYGDKETFWMGFESVSEPFTFHKDLPGTTGTVEEVKELPASKLILAFGLPGVKAQNHVDAFDNMMLFRDHRFWTNNIPRNDKLVKPAVNYRICAAQLLHSDENGDPSWINGGLFENKYAENYKLGSFHHWTINAINWDYRDGYPCAFFNDRPRNYTDSQRLVLEQSKEMFLKVFIE